MHLLAFIVIVIGLLSILPACVAISVPTPALPATAIATPNPSPTVTQVTEADQCEQQATTQLDINKCAAKQRDEAARQLEDTVKQVLAKFSPETRYAYLTEISPRATVIPPETFAQLQTDWKAWAERECVFRYGRIISDTAGLQYENGSGAPMLVASCETAKYKQRIEELHRLYLDKQ
jgi:uncharacterized protein YecT (DUF1311 family)